MPCAMPELTIAKLLATNARTANAAITSLWTDRPMVPANSRGRTIRTSAKCSYVVPSRNKLTTNAVATPA